MLPRGCWCESTSERRGPHCLRDVPRTQNTAALYLFVRTSGLPCAVCRRPLGLTIMNFKFVHATLRRRKLFACCGYGSLGACLAAWGASIFGHQSVLCVRAFTSRASGVESGAHMPAASLTSVLLVMLSLRSAAPSPSTLASAGNQDDFLAARVMMRRKPDAALPDVCSVVCV